MWHTSRGDRTLLGAEAELVGHAVDALIDALITYIEDDSLHAESSSVASECYSGIRLFDDLTPSQRVALLHDVTEHLLTPTDAPLSLSAHAEAAVAAIFVEVRDQVAIEIDLFPDGSQSNQSDEVADYTWRQLVLAAHECVFVSPQDVEDVDLDVEPFPDDIELPDKDCTDIQQWEWIIESLTDAILWDRDYEMADSFLDVDPGVSQQRRRLLGIDDNYFTQVAPDPSGTEAIRLAERAQAIVRRKPR